MSFFEEQGTGANVRAHLLTPRWDISKTSWGKDASVVWELSCPHNGSSIPCGMWVECTKHPRPEADWKQFEGDEEALHDAVEAWKDEHGPEGTHHGPDCWWVHMVENRESEPENYLSEMPHGEAVEPTRVLVGSEGYDEEADIRFRPWKGE